ncbi:ribbon-helix-helix domain-containing protein [bacterium]|nr:ribbon-helix-helix domain-containing protein [bacterium]
MSKQKSDIITFKADDSLVEALRQIPNRSEFIRSALLTALENMCPLCQGRGALTPAQKKHWEEFARDHALAECTDCHEVHLVCAHGE